jgi:hypothetical protein
MYNIGEGPKKKKAIQPAKRKERKNKDACALCIGPFFSCPISNCLSSCLVFASICPEAYGVIAVSLHGSCRHKYIIKRFLLRANHMFQVITMKIEAQSFIRAGLTTLGLVIRPCTERSPCQLKTLNFLHIKGV